MTKIILRNISANTNGYLIIKRFLNSTTLFFKSLSILNVAHARENFNYNSDNRTNLGVDLGIYHVGALDLDAEQLVPIIAAPVVVMESPSTINIIKAISFSFFAALLSYHISSFGSEDICKKIINTKEPHAWLLSEDGSFANGGIDFGDFDIDKFPDYIYKNKKYRIILYPSNFYIDENCELGYCLKTTTKKATCPKTAEFFVEVGINPRKVAPGNFSQEIDFPISDKNHGVVDKISFSFEKKIFGLIHLPWLEAENNNSGDKLNSFDQASDLATLKISNTGNKKIFLKTWNAIDGNKNNLDLTIEKNNCENFMLDVGQHCQITIKRVGKNPLKSPIYAWIISSDLPDYTSKLIAIREKGNISKFKIDNR